jgi:hypothetical protein
LARRDLKKNHDTCRDRGERCAKQHDIWLPGRLCGLQLPNIGGRRAVMARLRRILSWRVIAPLTE